MSRWWCRTRERNRASWSTPSSSGRTGSGRWPPTRSERLITIGWGEAEQIDGRFAVMRMPSGDQKQLTYDLTARIVDTGELPVNTIIVSTWARTAGT
jgi:hypothetical protein